MFVWSAVSTRKVITMDEESAGYLKYIYRGFVAYISECFIELYVDLFFLWLLYRFMKPQIDLKDGRTKASALLFAHDGKIAQEILLDLYKGDEEKRKEQILKKNHQAFFDNLIKEWTSEIRTEMSITCEFMDQSQRSSFTSSPSNFAKTEEVEELMRDAYPVDIDEALDDNDQTYESSKLIFNS